MKKDLQFEVAKEMAARMVKAETALLISQEELAETKRLLYSKTQQLGVAEACVQAVRIALGTAIRAHGRYTREIQAEIDRAIPRNEEAEKVVAAEGWRYSLEILHRAFYTAMDGKR